MNDEDAGRGLLDARIAPALDVKRLVRSPVGRVDVHGAMRARIVIVVLPISEKREAHLVTHARSARVSRVLALESDRRTEAIGARQSVEYAG